MIFQLIVSIGTIMAVSVPKQPEDGRMYFPARVGTKWVYHGEIAGEMNGDKTDVYIISSAKHKDGVTTVVVDLVGGNGMDVGREVNISAQGLYLAEPGSNPPSKRHYILKYPSRKGDKWSSVLVICTTGDSGMAFGVQCDFRVISVEQIEVPAGKFSTICIESTMSHSGSVVKTQTVWYAPGVGPVKMVEDGKARVLKSVAIGKE